MQREVSETKADRRNRGCGIIFFLLMLGVGSLWGAGLGVFVWILDDSKTTIEAIEDFRPKVGSKIYSSDGELIGEFAEQKRETVPLSEIPLHLQKAFVATEDDSFYQHRGVNPLAIPNAIIYYFKTNHLRGASTITQQLVGNVDTLGVDREDITFRRKIREAIVALQVEREFTKDEILALYLNLIFLGNKEGGAWGVEVASQQFFNKSCRDVNLSEAAMLAGLARSPAYNEPIQHFPNALARRNIVLDQMLKNGFITQKEHDAAIAEDLAASVVTPEERAQLAAEGKGSAPRNTTQAPYFVEEIRSFIMDQYGLNQVRQEGLEVRTTLDMRLQRAAEKALLTHLAEFDAKKLEGLKRAGKEDEFVPVTGGLVCLDNREPYRGWVRAMVGGRDFSTNKYNNATQAKRACGSSVKPFVWATAIASGMTPSTIVVDEPISRMDGAHKLWTPKNFDGKHLGPMPIRRALELSVNIVSVKLVEQLGPPLIISLLQRCGISTPFDPAAGLTIALGTPEVHLLDHCTAYSCFPNGGVRHDPIMISEILNRDGVVRYRGADYARSEQVMDPKVAYVTLHMMEGVCSGGTGTKAAVLKRPVGGKTGTSNDSVDVWFCGYTADFTCVVWVGYGGSSRSLGSTREFTGGALACPIWVDFMMAAEEGLPVRDFDVPDGIEFFNIDRKTGVLGGSYKEAYAKGTGPPGYAPEKTESAENLDSSLRGTIEPGPATPSPGTTTSAPEPPAPGTTSSVSDPPPLGGAFL